MKQRFQFCLGLPLFATSAFVLLLMSTAHSQDKTAEDRPSNKPTVPSAPAAKSNPLDILKIDEGNWDAEVSLWPRPGRDPIKSRAKMTAHMILAGRYLEQRIEGTFGPELGNKTWASTSITGFNASAGLYETVRLSSSESPMILVRGKLTSNDKKETILEQSGEYTMMEMKATERDVIRHEGNDKCIVESWMSFAGSPEFKGSEMVFTRSKSESKAPTVVASANASIRLGNFSVSLPVKDLKVSRAYYEKLGFNPVAGDAKNYSIMQNETATIGLFQESLERNMLTFNPGWDRTASPLKEFDDVRDIQKVLKARGIEFKSLADENTTGPASFIVHDPDGNPILVDQHVPGPEKK